LRYRIKTIALSTLHSITSQSRIVIFLCIAKCCQCNVIAIPGSCDLFRKNFWDI